MNVSDIPDNRFSQSGFHPGESRFVIGADVISILSRIKYPMIMIDRITSFHSNPISLTAERFVSANEPAFTGHFPEMKLWPGIYTLEGLRQTCYLLHVLRKMEEAALLENVIELQNRQMLRPGINHKLCQEVKDYLEATGIYDPDIFSISIKLLEPVFAGSLIRYTVLKDDNDPHSWSVNAIVDERLIAKGRIIQSFGI